MKPPLPPESNRPLLNFFTFCVRVTLGLFFLLLISWLSHAVVERPALTSILGINWESFSPDVAQEITELAVTKTALLLLPALFFSAVHRAPTRLRLHAPRLAALTIAFFFLTLDLSVFTSVGRHLSSIAYLLGTGGSAGVAGDPTLWIFSGLRSFAVALISASLVHFPATLTEQYLLRALKGRPKYLFMAPLFTGLGIFAVIFPQLNPTHLGEGLEERLYGAFAVDTRIHLTATSMDAVGEEGRLKSRLTKSYRKYFSRLRKHLPPSRPLRLQQGPRPSILFLVLESWRADALTAEKMPRLFSWSKKNAIYFSQHEAGTHSSEAGMFSLLYGRNNLTFHETLDSKQRAPLLSWLTEAGYQTAYYTGHPQVWLRREEFLNPNAVDIWSHDDKGTWPEWDKRALSAAVDGLQEAERPLFALVFLMSTHFEYQYPEKYGRHQPVATSKMWKTDVRALGEEDREPHLNRYKNTLGFLDDLVVDTLNNVPKDTIILITGDHGESFFEGGLYGHGYAFNDAVLKVPLIARFPKSPAVPGRYHGPSTVEKKTLHQDVLGWLMEYLNAGTLPIPGFQGIADWTNISDQRAVLSTYATPRKGTTRALFTANLSGHPEPLRLRLSLNHQDPALALFGFDDQYGNFIPTPSLSPEQLEMLMLQFEDTLRQGSL